MEWAQERAGGQELQTVSVANFLEKNCSHGENEMQPKKKKMLKESLKVEVSFLVLNSFHETWEQLQHVPMLMRLLAGEEQKGCRQGSSEELAGTVFPGR